MKERHRLSFRQMDVITVNKWEHKWADWQSLTACTPWDTGLALEGNLMDYFMAQVRRSLSKQRMESLVTADGGKYYRKIRHFVTFVFNLEEQNTNNTTCMTIGKGQQRHPHCWHFFFISHGATFPESVAKQWSYFSEIVPRWSSFKYLRK